MFKYALLSGGLLIQYLQIHILNDHAGACSRARGLEFGAEHVPISIPAVRGFKLSLRST